MDDTTLKNLENSLPAPWEQRGISMESYAEDLTSRLNQVNDLINGRRTDATIVKSTVKDTLEFIAWASAKKEMTSAVALIRAHLMKAQGRRHGKSNRIKTEGVD